MHDAPRQTLRELIARYGPGLCSDARRCEGLLRDLCGAHRREINTLAGALRERVPLDLLAAQNSVPRDLLLTRLAKRLEDHLALTEEAARWAVDSWALALGVVSDAELEEREGRRVEAAAPRVEAARTTATPRPPAGVDDAQAGGPATSSSTRPSAPPHRTPQHTPPAQGRQTPLPPPTQTPPASRPTRARPPAPPWARPPAQGSATVAARQPPPAPNVRAPSSPQAANTGRLQSPSPDPSARGGRGRRRGCLLGCLLLILLSVLLFVGGPFVLNVLREEQRQRSLGSPPVQTR